MSAVLGTVIPLFLALQPHKTARANARPCSLGEPEVQSIQGLPSGRNKTCLHNVTIGTVLAL